MEKKNGKGRKGGRILLPNELRACRGGGEGVAGPIVVREECRGKVCEIVFVVVGPDGVEGRADAAADLAREVLWQRC